MSSNKNVYFEVTTISSVRANNKAEALRAVQSRRRIPNTEVLASATVVDRIPATEARTLAESITGN